MSAQLLKSFVLTHDEEVAFSARARHLLHTALAATPKAAPALDKMGLRVYKDDIKKEYLCTGLVQASLRDVAYALYADCTRDVKTVAALLLGKAYQDAAVLRALLTRTDTDSFQFLGAKLVSINKTGIFGKPKDLVYLEYSGTYVPPGSASSPVLYQILEWVDMTHYLSPANVWHRAIRPACSMVHLFRPVAGNPRVVSLLSQTTYAREVPVYLRNLNTTASYCDHVQQLSTLPASRRLLDGNCLVQHWVPEAKACSVCALSFKALRPKYNCRSCGDVMCSNCTHHLQAPTTINKYCTKCVLAARQREGPPPSVAQVPAPRPLDRIPTFLYTGTDNVDNANDDDDDDMDATMTSCQDLLSQRPANDQLQETFAHIEKKLAEQSSLLSSMRDVMERRRQSLVSSSVSGTEYDSCASFDPDSLVVLGDDDDARFEEVVG